MNSHTTRGVMMVLAAAVLWGTTGTAQSFAPLALSSCWIGALRLGSAALFLWPALWLADGSSLSTTARRRVPGTPVVTAAVCICTYNLAFFEGVRACGVAIGTAVALGSGPPWAGLLQSILDRRVPAARWWLGTGIAVAGVTVMAAGDAAGATPPIAGVALCLLAGLSYAIYALVNQRMVANAPPAVVTGRVFSLAAAMAVASATLIAGAPALQPRDVPIVLWLGVVSTGVAYLLFSHALRYVSAATAVVVALAEPVTAFALAIAVVGERPSGRGFVGLAAVLLGLVVVIRSETRADGTDDSRGARL